MAARGWSIQIRSVARISVIVRVQVLESGRGVHKAEPVCELSTGAPGYAPGADSAMVQRTFKTSASIPRLFLAVFAFRSLSQSPVCRKTKTRRRLLCGLES